MISEYWFSYDTKPGETIYVQTGVSFVSEENALLNLTTEQPKLDFAAVRRAAEDSWGEGTACRRGRRWYD